MIAHQWRQPLTAISSTVSTLSLDIMMDNYNEEFFKDQLEKISSYSQHLSSTIDDFRNFSKQDKKMQETTLAELVENTFSITRPSLESKSIILTTNYNCKKKVITYPNELKQVILNLIKNAEDILLENKIKNPKITIETSCNDGYCILSVEDNAGGIPENIIDKIFDPYFSTKKAKDGTGLGLYMSKTIIEDHCGGKLIALNGASGAIFKIRLKVEDER